MIRSRRSQVSQFRLLQHSPVVEFSHVNDSENELQYLKISPYDHHSSSSINWTSRFLATSVNFVERSETKACDEVSMNLAYDSYVSANFEEQMDFGENETKQPEYEEALENFFFSSGVIPDSFVLSLGRWNVNQDDSDCEYDSSTFRIEEQSFDASTSMNVDIDVDYSSESVEFQSWNTSIGLDIDIEREARSRSVDEDIPSEFYSPNGLC
ncbi:hypothetical protein L1887_18876 [Cichorium endivia]|nr:hypothetical protein L1887_18876 [Cichorium endivia]